LKTIQKGNELSGSDNLDYKFQLMKMADAWIMSPTQADEMRQWKE
jgi:hypothetical protein